MTQIDYKFIKPIPSVSPTDSPVVADDTLLEAIDKLQGQINARPKQEVFVLGPSDPLPTLDYPALAFVPVTIDGQQVYSMQVNVP